MWKLSRTVSSAILRKSRLTAKRAPTSFARKCSDLASSSTETKSELSSPLFGAFQLDTHQAFKRLKFTGLTEDQAEAVTQLMVQTTSSLIEAQHKMFVTKSQQELMMEQISAHLSSIKKDMAILEKSEFASLRHDTEKQSLAIKHLENKLQDELAKVKGGFTLDLNLEKSRVKDEQSSLQLELNRLHNKIDTEIANLNTTFEKFKNDLFKYFAGTVFSCLTICLGFYRLWTIR